MKQQRRWEILNKYQISNSKYQINSKEAIEHIVQIILENRGLKTKEEVDSFLHPKLSEVTIDSVGIDRKHLEKTLARLKSAIENKETIVVFGDYDVDGITGTAILWETLYALGADVHPYIPHRVDEGYGLSTKGISNVKSQIPNLSLIITVDNGIVANEAVNFAAKQGIEVIITDHHTVGEKLPDAYAIVHTTKLCGAGVAWMLSKEIKNYVISKEERLRDPHGISPELSSVRNDNHHLDLVALATVADLVPLTGANRAILREALPHLRETKRVGLQELFNEARISAEDVDVYQIGHIIGPRLNAMGRMESAMDSLRLLCTKDRQKARMLAARLGITNRERQVVTQSASLHAIESVKGNASGVKNLLFIAHEEYEEGVIGLIAGKLVEEYYRPAIVVSIGEKMSKASARSVSGFNIIEFIRGSSDLLINAGGHPMAAGFTVETQKLALLQEALEKVAEQTLTQDMLTPLLKIDVEVPLSFVSQQVYVAIRALAPFGMANPEPVFMSRGVTIGDIRTIGRDKNHLKMKITNPNVQDTNKEQASNTKNNRFEFENWNVGFDAIAFGMGEYAQQLHSGDMIDIVYTIDENEWNGRKNLQLKIKDIKISN